MPVYDENKTEFDPFSEESLDTVAAVEALPDMHAFEHLMYANRLERTAKYVMDKPIDIRFMNGKFPDELRDFMPIGRVVEIEKLVAHMTEPQDSLGSVIKISFEVNGDKHELITTSAGTAYTIERGDTLHYTLPGEVANQFLAALVYARQYNPDSSEEVSFQFEDSRIQTPRLDMVDFAERAILTLGDFDGSSQVTTIANFSTSQDTVVARLREIEKPTLSGVQSKLDLRGLEDYIKRQQTEIQENKTVAPEATMRLSYAKIVSGEDEVFIDPEANFLEWSMICQKFMRIIKEPLESLAYLDDPA